MSDGKRDDLHALGMLLLWALIIGLGFWVVVFVIGGLPW